MTAPLPHFTVALFTARTHPVRIPIQDSGARANALSPLYRPLLREAAPGSPHRALLRSPPLRAPAKRPLRLLPPARPGPSCRAGPCAHPLADVAGPFADSRAGGGSGGSGGRTAGHGPQARPPSGAGAAPQTAPGGATADAMRAQHLLDQLVADMRPRVARRPTQRLVRSHLRWGCYFAFCLEGFCTAFWQCVPPARSGTRY